MSIPENMLRAMLKNQSNAINSLNQRIIVLEQKQKLSEIKQDLKDLEIDQNL